MDFLSDFLASVLLKVSLLPPWFVYVIIAAVVYLECAAFLGTVVPGETALAFAGFLASKGILKIEAIIPLAAFFAFLGDITGYYLGRRFGENIFTFSNRFFKFSEEYINLAKGFFQKYGALTMLIARFVGFLRAGAPFLAGASKTRLRDFIFFDFLGSVLWAILITYAGYYLGESFSLIEKYTGRIGIVIILAVASIFTGRSIIRAGIGLITTVRQRIKLEFLLSIWFLVSASLLIFLGNIAGKPADELEQKVVDILVGIRNSGLDLVSIILTTFGSGYFIVFLSLVSIAIFFLRKRLFDALIFLATVVVSNTFSLVLKNILRTTRPDVPLISEPQAGFSFPSGHVVASSIIFWILGWIALREGKGLMKFIAYILFALPVGVGFSRIYLGYHWPVDVLGGYALSFMIFSVWVILYERLSRRIDRE